MAKLLKYGETWQTIESDNLLHTAQDTSSFLKIELDRVAKETGIIGENVRGYGTYLAFDCEDAHLMQRWLWRNGINVLRCGPNTLGLRPSLTLGCDDAAHLRDALFAYHPNFDLNIQ